MRNSIMSHLRDAVREEILYAFEVTGHARPREIARLVCATRTADILTIGARLAEDALTEIARRELKKSTQDRDPDSQMELPGVPASLISQLPQAISIPVEDTDLDHEEYVIYKPLTQATLAELDAHLGLLSDQIVADTRRHRALKELRDLAGAAGCARDRRVLASLSGAHARHVREVFHG